MIKNLLTFSVFLFFVEFSVYGITDQQKEKVLAEISKASSSIQTMSAQFEQVKEISLLDEKMVSSGKIYYERPDRLRWEYVSPYQYLFIANRNNLYIGNMSKKEHFDTNTNKIFKEIVRIMMSTVTGSALNNQADFSFSVSDSGVNWEVRLIPVKKEIRSMFSQVVISFSKDNYIVSGINIMEKNGDSTSLKFKNVQLNRKIDGTLFSLPK